ncbi:hypothetical protein M2131_000860 [Polynucleobacter sphagniphilus]|nr:hypothetical protein [Polynucleobacter sphagniphilus]
MFDLNMLFKVLCWDSPDLKTLGKTYLHVE